MKKFKRIIINAISFVIAILLLISPLDVLAGTANTTNVIESSNKYVAGTVYSIYLMQICSSWWWKLLAGNCK